MTLRSHGRITLLIGALGLVLSQLPASAYNGNIPYMMWNTQRSFLTKDYGRASTIIGIALTHLEDEGFDRSARLVEQLDERLAEADEREAAWIAAEKQAIALRLEWLTELREENEWWRDELSKPESGALALVDLEIRRRLVAERDCLTPESEAARIEFEEGDFTRAHELRQTALTLWQAEVEDATGRRDRMHRGLDRAETDAEKAELAARATYLDLWATRAIRHTDALAREVAAETDPALLATRLKYYEARDEFYRPSRCEAFDTMAELYRQKIAWALDGADSAPTIDAAKITAPEWFCSTVMDPQWYRFPMQAPE